MHRGRTQMDTVTTTLMREYFAQIVDGSKRIEYRQIKRYWTERLRKVSVPFRLVLRNGMNPPIPVLTVRIDKVVPDPHGKGHRGNYELHIGRILKVEHWDRRRKVPR